MVFLITSVFIIIPFFFMIYGAVVPSYGSREFTLSFLAQALTDKNTIPLLVTTLEFGAGGAALALLLGTTYSWFMNRTDIPWKRFLELLPILPLAVPSVVKAISWTFLFSPNIGLVNVTLERLFNLPGPLFDIYSVWGLIFAWGVSGVPFVYILMGPVIRSIDPALEESSKLLGAGILGTLRRVTLPLIRPALLSTFLLWTISGTENFDYPLIFGVRGNTRTLASEVYLQVQTFQNALAAAYGIIYLMLTVSLVAVYIWSVRRSYRFVTVSGKGAGVSIHALGCWKWPSLVLLLFVLVFTFFLPVGMIVLVSLIPVYTVGGGVNPFTKFTLNNFAVALQTPQLAQAVVNSFVVTIATGFLATFAGVTMAYLLVKSRSKGKSYINFVSYFPIAFPAVVYSTALIWTFLVIPVFNTYLYGTVWVMIVALTVLWIPYSVRVLSATMIQLSDELEEAAAVAGSTWAQRFRRVMLPLLKNALANSFVYIMVGSFRDVGAIILLYSSQSITFVILLYNAYAASSGTLPSVAALAVLMIALLMVTIFGLRVALRKRIRFSIDSA